MDPVALSATQCGATIHNGTNSSVEEGTESCPGVNTNTNCGVDNPAFAYASARLNHQPGLENNSGNHIKTSLEPLFINCCDINFQRTKGLSNKAFAHISYTWELTTWSPYVGFGGSVEFGKNEGCPSDCPVVIDCEPCSKTDCEPRCCTDALYCSLSQWAVWAKGGVSFD